MNNTDWQQWLEQLGRELYDSSTAYNTLLPELADLARTGKEYRSSYKLNGEKRNQRDKTVITAQCPMVVLEHGEPAQNLVKYIEQRDGKSFIEVVKWMAELVWQELPRGDYDSQKWKEREQRKEMLVTVWEYYQYCLNDAKNKPTAVVNYLHGRGLTDENIKAMGLGYIPSQQHLQEYLKEKGYTVEQVQQYIHTMGSSIGSTHQIAIPLYRAGSIYTFVYRHHNQHGTADKPKYQYHTSTEEYPAKQTEGFTYIPARVDAITIVEGQLDALHLLAEGIEGVVAAGRNCINTAAVEDAIKRGCRAFTIMFDSDPTNSNPDKNYSSRKAAAKTIADTAQRMEMQDDVKIYIADIPQSSPSQKVDPDSYITDNGADAVRQVIKYRLMYWQYAVNHELQKYTTENGELYWETTAIYNDFIDNVCSIYDEIVRPAEQELCKKYLREEKKLDEVGLTRLLDEHHRKTRAKQAQTKAAQLLKQAARLMEEGQTEKAREIQSKAASILGENAAEEEYSRLTRRTTRADIVAGLQQMPDAINTGLYLGEQQTPDNEIILPSGGLSVLAAPTSHGKTTVLVAIAVEAAKNNPSKEYYLLSYEEALEPITLKALSCYAGLELSGSNRRTLQHYFTTDSWQYAYTDQQERLQAYQRKEKEFFEILEHGRLHLHNTDMVCEALCSNIRRLAASGKLGGVFIDYVQYLELANTQRNYQRHEEIGKICRMLKDAAVDTGTPIVLAAQFNREVKDPTKLALQSLGEGGEIERKAAYCLGFWNNDMPTMMQQNTDTQTLHKLTHGQIYDPERPHKNKTITAMVLKNRSGIGAKAGTSGLLAFDGNIGTVGNYTQSQTDWADNSTDEF